MVLAYRREFDRPFAITLTDKARFQYLTIWLPEATGDETATYDLAAQGNGYAFYSTATFGFSGSSGCFGVARNGTITIRRGILTAAKVRLELDIPTKPLSTVLTEDCGPVEFAGEYPAEIIDLGELDQALMTPLR